MVLNQRMYTYGDKNDSGASQRVITKKLLLASTDGVLYTL